MGQSQIGGFRSLRTLGLAHRVRVFGLGFRVWGLGFGVLGFGVLGFGAESLGFRV